LGGKAKRLEKRRKTTSEDDKGAVDRDKASSTPRLSEPRKAKVQNNKTNLA